MKILLVDDEIEFVSALSERLSFRGIESDWVADPEAAIPLVEDNGCYDIAVLDVKMPKVSGIALKKKLHERCPNMKFIFLTGHGSEDAFKEGASEAGADYYLMKPVQIEQLLLKIKIVAGDDRKEG